MQNCYDGPRKNLLMALESNRPCYIEQNTDMAIINHPIACCIFLGISRTLFTYQNHPSSKFLRRKEMLKATVSLRYLTIAHW
jgi:hypothetical protein